MDAEASGLSSRTGILFINNAPFLGGAQVTLRAIIERLDRTRFQPFLAIPADQAHLAPYFASPGLEIVSVPLPALTGVSPRVIRDLARTVRELRRLIVERHIQLIHSNTQRGGPVGVLLQALTGARFIWTLNDLGLYRRVQAWTPFPAAVTCVSQAMLESLPRLGRRRAQVIYNGVVVRPYSAEERKRHRRDLRHAIGVRSGMTLVGCISRLEPWKGVHVVVEAMSEVMARHPDVAFVHVGDKAPAQAEYADQVLDRIAALPGGRGHHIGFQLDAQRWYPALDLLAHTPIVQSNGHSDSFGMVVAEAMGHGVPVVCSQAGGLPEVVGTEGGLMVTPGSANELSAALSQLVIDPALRRALAMSGRRRQLALFDQNREVRDFERLYAQVLSG